MRRLLTALLLGTTMVVPVAASAGMAEKTVKALQSLADRGSARAQYELADALESGKGTPRNARMALAYYCKAAKQGHGDAAYRAGQMYVAGLGVAADEETGRNWIRRASWLGSEHAQRSVRKPATEPKGPERCEPPNVTWRGVRTPPAEVKAMVAKIAPVYGVDPDLVLAVIAVESGYNASAVSPKSAMGLMQLIPDTATRFGVTNVFDPEQNIRGGVRYLRWLLAYFDGDVTLALAGYNAGEGAVTQHKGVPPYRETQNYVLRIGGIYSRKTHPFDRTVVASAGLAPRKEQVAELSYATQTGANAALTVASGVQPKRASIED